MFGPDGGMRFYNPFTQESDENSDKVNIPKYNFFPSQRLDGAPKTRLNNLSPQFIPDVLPEGYDPCKEILINPKYNDCIEDVKEICN